MILKGNYNTGVITSDAVGSYCKFKLCLNHFGIANIPYIPKLEENSYIINYSTKTD